VTYILVRHNDSFAAPAKILPTVLHKQLAPLLYHSASHKHAQRFKESVHKVLRTHARNATQQD